MTLNDFYCIRIPSSSLRATREEFLSQNKKSIHNSESQKIDWFKVSNTVISVVENEDKETALVKYCYDIQSELIKLDDLGIVSSYTVDEQGNHFECFFYDPGGLKIILAEIDDLPQSLLKEVSSNQIKELAIPSTNQLNDSIHFWVSLGFEINYTGAKNHPWATLKHLNLDLGIHQHYMWPKVGVFSSENQFEMLNQILSLRIHKYN